MDKITQASLLYDYYGNLLPEKQGELYRLHYEDNYSFAEIAEDLGITRQGVHDFIRRAEKSLREYEEKLGLVAASLEKEAVFEELENTLARLESEDPGLGEKLTEIRRLTERLL
ncbi:MAG: hypothetical protein IJO79_03045 [Firmicutes bacterium]|nr:hypothetical protein [Bacillota bacterium]